MKMLLVAIAVLPFIARPAEAQRERCPQNAVAASFDVWPQGRLFNAVNTQGAHPCGRTLICSGGNYAQGVPRECRWR